MTSRPTSNPWGRPLPGSPAASPTELLESKFREVGLGQDDARQAARGLKSGLCRSFMEAAISRSTFGSPDSRVVTVSLAEAVAVAKALGEDTSAWIQERSPIAPDAGHKGLVEHRAPSQARLQLLERASAAISGDGRLKVCLISEGQGSSGYYPAGTLAEAATAGVFAAGTHCYVDHPTQSETFERPERSIRDLAGVLETAATYRNGALYADVRVYASHRELITDRASVIGMSIRGDGVVERKDVGGFKRSVVTSLARVHSVDFVTQPGRGGRILDVA